MIVHRAGVSQVPDAVLFDRDGTLVVDVPDNGDPAQVRPDLVAAVCHLFGADPPRLARARERGS